LSRSSIWQIARTGLRDHEARTAGFNPRTVASSAPDHKPYYPTAHMRWSADADTDRLLGCQIAGHRAARAAKRIDTAATAIFADLTIDQISDLDLSYSPPPGRRRTRFRSARRPLVPTAPRSTSRRSQLAGTNIRIDSGMAGAL
jgi:Pyridine nucleotide-disulphide oxidoreductase, dimerisation domain